MLTVLIFSNKTTRREFAKSRAKCYLSVTCQLFSCLTSLVSYCSRASRNLVLLVSRVSRHLCALRVLRALVSHVSPVLRYFVSLDSCLTCPRASYPSNAFLCLVSYMLHVLISPFVLLHTHASRAYV